MAYTDVIRSNLGERHIAEARRNIQAAKQNTASDQLNSSLNASQHNQLNRAQARLLATNCRLSRFPQVILDMSTQIAEQKAKIRALEETILCKDRELAAAKERVEIAEKHCSKGANNRSVLKRPRKEQTYSLQRVSAKYSQPAVEAVCPTRQHTDGARLQVLLLRCFYMNRPYLQSKALNTAPRDCSR